MTAIPRNTLDVLYLTLWPDHFSDASPFPLHNYESFHFKSIFAGTNQLCKRKHDSVFLSQRLCVLLILISLSNYFWQIFKATASNLDPNQEKGEIDRYWRWLERGLLAALSAERQTLVVSGWTNTKRLTFIRDTAPQEISTSWNVCVCADAVPVFGSVTAKKRQQYHRAYPYR